MHDNTSQREYIKEQATEDLLDKTLILRLLSYLRPHALILIAALIFLIFSKLIEAAVPVLIGKLSQVILDGHALLNKEKALALHEVLNKAAFILGLLIVSYIFDSLNVILRSWISQKALYKFRLQIYRHVLHMPVTYFDKHTIGRLMTRTIHDVDQINQMFAECVIPILGNLVLFLGILLGLAVMDWKIALMAILVLPVVIWLTHRFRYYQRICYERVRTVIAAMNTFVQEHLMGAATVRNFGLQEQSKSHFEEINEDYCQAYQDSIKNFSFFMASIDFLQNFSLILAFVLIILFAPAGEGFAAGIYFTFSLYALMFFRPLADLAERYNLLQSAMAAANRIFNLLDSSTETTNDLGTKVLKQLESVEFKDVWFAYDKEAWVLKGVTFTIQRNESCALVGMTGEGKSTIISLLLRFYEIQKGEIRLNGLPINAYTLESLRKQFSMVLQDPVLFSGSIADNISLYSADISKPQINAAIDYLGIRPLISSFSAGIEHFLNERGKDLSAGQRQLISLARAVVYQRPMLILDEATANIDTHTEHVIQKALKKMLSQQTALVVAHRLSTIQDVTRILVLQGGCIVEEGSHDVLLAKGGIYEKLCRLQFDQKNL